MTSRQPETMPPGTSGYAAISSAGRGDGGMRADRGAAGAGHRGASASRWPVRVLPLTLLIIVGLAGLGGEIAGLRWDGPLHGDPVAVGLALEVVLAIMLVITMQRLRAGRVSAAPAGAVAVKLRRVLVFVLGAGMIAVAVTIPVGLHRHVFSGAASGSGGVRRGQPGSTTSTSTSSSAATRPGRPFRFSFHPHLPHVPFPVLYGLLALLLLGGVALRMWWVRSYGRPGTLRTYKYLRRDSRDLRAAVESGRSALRAIDDARAAIIACYVAMENSLAERGTARALADTPDDLLRRATATGIVHGTAAARLTELFYEARFSSHPLDRGQRDAAGQALTELAAALAEAGPAAARANRSRANRGRAIRSRART
jgi:Domain of unknown function (DUF4129)